MAIPSADGHRLCGADRRLRGRLFPNAPTARRPDVAEQLAAADRRNGGLNFPKNYLSIWKNALFWPAVVFTIEYTVIVTVLLIGLGLGLALLVQERGRWVGHVAHSNPLARIARSGVGIAAVLGLLFALDRADQSDPPAAGTDPRTDLISWNVPERAAVHELLDRLEIRWPVHAYPARRAAGHSGRSL